MWGLLGKAAIRNGNYTGKVALVSGAGRGIGREIALELAKADCTVLCVSKNISSCGKVADEINASGGKAEAWAFDVSMVDADFDGTSELLSYGAKCESDNGKTKLELQPKGYIVLRKSAENRKPKVLRRNRAPIM